MGFKEIAVFYKIHMAWGLEKLGIILENKVAENLKLATCDFSKICLST